MADIDRCSKKRIYSFYRVSSKLTGAAWRSN